MAKVSVITIVKDNLIGLRNTHESLLRQSFSDWEMIIVVGDSSDGTLTFARTLQREDSRICLIEQKGVGIYEAMNDGLCIASFGISSYVGCIMCWQLWTPSTQKYFNYFCCIIL